MSAQEDINQETLYGFAKLAAERVTAPSALASLMYGNIKKKPRTRRQRMSDAVYSVVSRISDTIAVLRGRATADYHDDW